MSQKEHCDQSASASNQQQSTPYPFQAALSFSKKDTSSYLDGEISALGGAELEPQHGLSGEDAENL